MQTDNVALDAHCQFSFNVALVPAATGAATSAEQAFTMPVGTPPLKAGDIVDVTGPGSGNAVALAGGRVNATGQLVLAFVNPTAGSLTHAAGNFGVVITRV